MPPNYFKARGTALTAIEADMLAHGTPNKMAKECAELGLSVGLVAIDESRPDYGVALTTQTTQSCLNKGRQR